MNVLMLTSYGPSSHLEAGGIATASANLIDGLLAAGGHELTIVTLDYGAAESYTRRESRGVTVHGIARPSRMGLVTRYAPEYRRVRDLVRRERLEPDVIHGQGLAWYGLIASKLGDALGRASVVTVHGMWDIELRQYDGRARALLARAAMRAELRRVTRLILVSPYRREHLARFGRFESDVVENAIRGALFELPVPVAPPDPPTVLFAGALIRRKRPDQFLRCAQGILQRCPGSRFRIAGPPSDPAYFAELQRLAGDLGLSGAVTFLGSLAKEQMVDEYRRATLLLQTSEEENAPQVIAEAFAAGTPVVAADVGGVAWMLEGGAAGVPFPAGSPGDAIDAACAILNSPERWRALVAAGRAAAARFRPDRVAAETSRVYREAMASRREGAARV